MTFAERLRIIFKWILEPIGRFLNSIGLKPNTVTILGLVGNTLAAFLLSRGNLLAGGLMVLAIGPVDALDGTMARLRGESSAFGAFIDSVTDRYSELVILLGLLVYCLELDNSRLVLLIYLAASGSVLVSYVKARAEGLGMSANTGILTRVERYIVIAPSLIFNQIELGLWIIAILANFTALQRIFYVREHARKSNTKGN